MDLGLTDSRSFEAWRDVHSVGGRTPYHFVTGGLEAALTDSRAVAGDKDVGIWGGANTVTQYLQAGLLDEIQIHLIPILLGSGVRLFQDLSPAGIELRRTRSIDTPRATHFRFPFSRDERPICGSDCR